jgi:hypothetical protein
LDINLKKLQPIVPWDPRDYNVQTSQFFGGGRGEEGRERRGEGVIFYIEFFHSKIQEN